MAEHIVCFNGVSTPVSVPTGTLLAEAASLAGIDLMQPCGGQGRCGRCALQIISGKVRRRSTIRLSEEDITQGYALACQTVIEGDISVTIPPQEKIDRLLTSDRTAGEVTVPPGYDARFDQTIQSVTITLTPPDMSDQRDDWSRFQTTLRQKAGIEDIHASLGLMRHLSEVLRQSEWCVAATLDTQAWDQPTSPPRLIDIQPGSPLSDIPLWGAAIDIGTTTVTVWLVDLLSGKVVAQVAQYNKQIARGEDVVSRIISASKNGGSEKMRSLVLETINELLTQACKRVKSELPLNPRDIVKACVVGNSTMIHLLLGIPAENIRLMPFITVVNQIPTLTAHEIGIDIHPDGTGAEGLADVLPVALFH